MASIPDIDSVLWNNLPYAGSYEESPYAGQTFLEIDTPPITSMHLIGWPLPLANNGVNKDLRLIGFSSVVQEGPITPVVSGFLVSYSPWLEYKVEWTTSKPCKIGFYVPSYMQGTDRMLLLISEKGPCFFEGDRGRFKPSWLSQLFVITNKEVEVILKVRCRSPERFTIPRLKLFVPVPYITKCGKVYAKETKLSDEEETISLVPTSKYIHVTKTIRDFLLATSVFLDFRPDVELLMSNEGLVLYEIPMLRVGESADYIMNINPNSFARTQYSPIRNPLDIITGVALLASTNASDPQNVNLGIVFNASITGEGQRVKMTLSVGATKASGFEAFTKLQQSIEQRTANVSYDTIIPRSKGQFEIVMTTSLPVSIKVASLFVVYSYESRSNDLLCI